MGQNLRSIVVFLLLIAVACTATRGGDDDTTTTGSVDTSQILSTTEAPATTAPLLQTEWSAPEDLAPDVRSALVGALEEHGGAALLPTEPPNDEWERAALVVFIAAEGAETVLHVGPIGNGLTLRSRPSAVPCGAAWETVEVRGQPGCIPNSGLAASLRWIEGTTTFDVTYTGLEQQTLISWLDSWEVVP